MEGPLTLTCAQDCSLKGEQWYKIMPSRVCCEPIWNFQPAPVGTFKGLLTRQPSETSHELQAQGNLQYSCQSWQWIYGEEIKGTGAYVFHLVLGVIRLEPIKPRMGRISLAFARELCHFATSSIKDYSVAEILPRKFQVQVMHQDL